MLCKKCNLEFASERSLHAHLKAHGLSLPEYYCEYYPRRDLLTRQAIPFKQKNEYFLTHFVCRENMLEWLTVADEEEAKSMALSMLKDRISTKGLLLAPNDVELYFADLPPISEYKRLFGSYSKVCELAGVQPMFAGKLPNEWKNDFSGRKIFYDSREQQRLQFANSECLKLDIGDYSTARNDYTNTFVDRKSFADWCGTLVGDNLDRFRREIVRAETQECFLWVVIECAMEDVVALSKRGKHKPNISYIAHNMRCLQHEFSKNLQFVFSGSRENSQLIIPKLLCLGRKCWSTDLQYFLK